VVDSTATQIDFFLFDEASIQPSTNRLTADLPTTVGPESGSGYVASSTTATDLVHLDYMALA
jgi:hypothetical protein